MNTERIDLHKHTEKLQRELTRLHGDQGLLPEHRRVIAGFIADARAGRTVRRGAKRRLSDGRCLKYLFFLRRFAKEIPVPFERVTLPQMERFIFGIEDGSIEKLIANHGTTRYSHESVLDHKKLLRKFYRWLIGHDTARFHELTGWFDMSESPPELRTFGLEEVERMADGAESIQGRALVMLLFDGGFRPGELFNVRLSDVSFKPDTEGRDTCFVRIRHSKTKPRTVSLPMATDAVRRWLARHPGAVRIDAEGRVVMAQPDELLIRWSYHYCKNFLRKLGRIELGERLYPYRFRHASATFYARFLTEYQMCARFGWVMGSDAVRRYVDASGVLAHDTASRIRNGLATQDEPSFAQLPSEPSFQRRAA